MNERHIYGGKPSYQILLGGGKLVYDAEAGASYLYVNSGKYHSGVDLGDGLVLDVSEDGAVLGVEHYSGELTIGELVQVLARIKVAL